MKVENAEIVMTTLNGLPRSWDAFIQGICARKKLVKFSRLWEECSQEEAWIAAREEKMGSEYQALTVHSKRGRRNPHYSKGKNSHSKDNNRKDLSRLRCYTCDEKDTLQKTVLITRTTLIRRRGTKEDIMLMLQRMMNHPRKDPDMKVKILQVRMNMI